MLPMDLELWEPVIERGIPIPEIKTKSEVAFRLLTTMKYGDSVLVPRGMIGLLYRTSKALNVRIFITNRVGEDSRMWVLPDYGNSM